MSRERIRPVEPAPPLHVVTHDGKSDGGFGAVSNGIGVFRGVRVRYLEKLVEIYDF